MAKKKYTVENEMARVVGALEGLDPTTDNYGSAARNLETLAKVTSAKSSNRPSADTVVLALTNIAGLVLVLYFEETRVIAGKAFQMIMKR